MKSIYAVCLTILLLALPRDCRGNEEEEVTPNNGCQGTALDVIAAVNATQENMIDSIVVNCLSYSDANTIESGIVSWSMGTERGRYQVGCHNGLLVLSTSANNYTDAIIGCLVCEDEESLQCDDDQECSALCQQCYGTMASQCVMCSMAEYNGSCVDSCPGSTTPNEYNVCGCPNYFTGIDCSTCGLEPGDCDSTYYINITSCDCEDCRAGFVQDLLDPYATVPASVIGSPEGLDGEEGGDEGHERKRRNRRQEGTGGEEHEAEPTQCVEMCPRGWIADDNNICYACGLTYCLECESSSNQCTRCRNGTLVSDDRCEGFYYVIAELAHELEEEVQHERDTLESHKLHLQIALPIVCAFVTFVFVAFTVFAHFRYPHVGHQKRHRKPNRSTTVTEAEKSFRPQSTVRFR